MTFEYPRRPSRTSQAERPRTRIDRIAALARDDGWQLTIVVLSGRPDRAPSIGLTTSGPTGGGARIHIDLEDLEVLEHAIAVCRAAATKSRT